MPETYETAGDEEALDSERERSSPVGSGEGVGGASSVDPMSSDDDVDAYDPAAVPPSPSAGEQGALEQGSPDLPDAERESREEPASTTDAPAAFRSM